MKAGTPGFQAPEKLRAEHIDERCDVYAVGAVLVELFGEIALWAGLDHYQIMCKVVVEKLAPDCSHLPSAIQTLCESCLSDYTTRPSSGEVLKDVIEISRTYL